jgi:diguanylate cyclase (GGDEF)-like protein
MCVPIKIQDKLVGVVNIADKKVKTNGVFTMTDLKILTSIVHQAAISIENANNYRRLELLSTTDPLTGIYNQRFFLQMLDQEIKRCERYPKPMCLLMMDIDDFKPYNDSFGHLEGDQLLIEVANVIKQNLRAVDTVCRYGGDEFLAILPETASIQAEIVAQKINSVVTQLKLRRRITVSIGIAGCKAGLSRQDFIERADRALYKAKKEGKNKVIFAV